MARWPRLRPMAEINLEILNADSTSTVQYMPHGVTTLEMQIAKAGNNRPYGSLRPDNRESKEEKLYVGHEDDGKDFLIVWGGGKKQGLEIVSENVTKRLFMQIIHTGVVKNSKITLWHSTFHKPVGVVNLTPATTSSEASKMSISTVRDHVEISFKGNLIPDYYCRWFPTRPAENRNLKYHAVNAPAIKIHFQATERSGLTSVDSDLEIFMNEKKIARVFGDWRYSWPHAELFNFLGLEVYCPATLAILVA